MMMTRSMVAIVMTTKRSMVAMMTRNMMTMIHTITHKSRKPVSILVAFLKDTGIIKNLAMEATDIMVAMEVMEAMEVMVAMEAMEVMEVMDTNTMKRVIQTTTAMDLRSIE